jgi:hypothetical protein
VSKKKAGCQSSSTTSPSNAPWLSWLTPMTSDFGSAGTIATLTGKGVDVAYCLVTSGDAGGDGSTLTREERTEIREGEQRAAGPRSA